MKATRMAALAATILTACGLGASAPPALLPPVEAPEAAAEREGEGDDGDRLTDPDPFPAWGETEASLRTAELDAATLATLRRS